VDFEISIEDAIARLASDGFVAYPTETVWGLGACADRPIAFERLMTWKRRSSDAPIAVLVPSADAAREMDCQIDSRAQRLMEAFWPGPLTIVVPCRRAFAAGVARSDGALGLRCSSHPLAHALALAVCKAGLGPLTSTSLNRSGEAPATDQGEASERIAEGLCQNRDADLRFPLQVSALGQDAGGSAASSVVDCTGSVPEVIRVGAIERETLEEFWTH
jgi:L-threonylcarbamoyladenylate synthase